ncbi:glycosyltransferase family 4 protein [Planococcus sp. N028]|uniref:Glycosyltransferase family 4 protein n=1 Tax=Planococcus shixiaomingii TaxID=3058393 RepID=A0ABT8N1E9_9BACL|nr:glycosyltransferase family 4 protein [Planococcus sp. N028]MDN7241710.1 glycosyltransferase family 4 protein [Planococcus sp. N028]
MKVLWVTNLPMHRMTTENNNKENILTTQSWLSALLNQMIKTNDIQLATVSIMADPKMEKIKDKKVTHYAIKSSLKNRTKFPTSSNINQEWKKIIEDFQPDLIHYHGTEFSHGLVLYNLYPEIPSVLSIQGLTTIIERHYFASIPYWQLFKRKTLFSWIFGGISKQKKSFKKRSYYEKKFLESIPNVIGRTDWDKAFVKSLSKTNKYYHCDEAMRSPFFEEQWDIENIERNTIFAPASFYPIKGFHLLLEAIKILKKTYPNIRIRVMGPNITKKNTLKEKLLQTDYSVYLTNLIEKNNLNQNIDFLGPLSDYQIAKEMKKSHVVVIPSAIENGCNVLSEAMLLGVPSVASSAGGMTTTLRHGVDGFSYNYNEIEMLAYYISEILENDVLANKFSTNAKKIALQRHQPKNVCERTIEIYKEILNEGKNNLIL